MVTDITKSERTANAINALFSENAFWPPPDARDRLRNYELNRKLYEGKHTQVFTRLNKVFNDNEAEHQKLVLVFNFHQRLSTLWADLTFGEQPIVKIDDDPKKDAFKRLSTDSNQFWSVCYQAVIDLSRFGECVFRMYFDEEKGAKLEVVSPQKWFPIVNPFTDEVLAHIIAYEIDQYVDHIKVTYVRTEIHTPGQIENRMYIVKEGKLHEVDIADFGIEANIKTDVKFMLVYPVARTTSSTDDLGQDDYKVIDSIIEGLEIRYTRIGRILDYHSEPDKGVPETAFELDMNGQMRFNQNKKTWPIIEGMPLPQYITWAEGGVMAANFTHIDKLMERLYEVSETCKAAFDIASTGRGLSGTAIRLMMSIPLKKAKRIGSLIYPVVPRLVKMMSELEVNRKFKGAVLIDDFTFTPQDGLPKDQTETINNMVALKGVNSVTDERMQHEMFGLEGDELKAEIEKLKQERLEANPPVPTPEKINPAQTAATISSQLANNKGPLKGR